MERRYDDQNRTLFLAGLPVEANESHVREVYSPYGTITSAFIVKHRGTDRSKGIGFVEFERPEQAEYALNQTNGMKFWENTIRVSWAKPLPPDVRERKNRLSQRRPQQDPIVISPQGGPTVISPRDDFRDRERDRDRYRELDRYNSYNRDRDHEIDRPPIRDIAPREIITSMRDFPPREITPRDPPPREIAPRDLPPRDIPSRDSSLREMPPRDRMPSREPSIHTQDRFGSPRPAPEPTRIVFDPNERLFEIKGYEEDVPSVDFANAIKLMQERDTAIEKILSRKISREYALLEKQAL